VNGKVEPLDAEDESLSGAEAPANQGEAKFS
jgi:hypothetical protein